MAEYHVCFSGLGFWHRDFVSQTKNAIRFFNRLLFNCRNVITMKQVTNYYAKCKKYFRISTL